MGVAPAPATAAGERAWVPYVAPFAAFLAFLALGKYAPLGDEWMYPLRLLVVTGVVIAFSRGVLDFRVKSALGSSLLGVAVFVIWIAPDVLWPAYRSHWLFTNSITGEAVSSAPDALRSNLFFIVFRTIGCVLLVPVIEELFWRGWLARWIIDGDDFRRVALGSYTAASFWIGSLLFASEHGPYWEVGLVAGVAYNWWMIRTKSLADCILAHAITNGCLSAYVLATGRWQYWM